MITAPMHEHQVTSVKKVRYSSFLQVSGSRMPWVFKAESFLIHPSLPEDCQKGFYYYYV